MSITMSVSSIPNSGDFFEHRVAVVSICGHKVVKNFDHPTGTLSDGAIVQFFQFFP
jgi:hypothetical protein